MGCGLDEADGRTEPTCWPNILNDMPELIPSASTVLTAGD
jgi:hypothetical protein